MVLREATHDDISTLVALIHLAFEEYRGQLEPPSGAHRETAQSISSYLQQGRAVLALRNGQVVGCVCYHQEGSMSTSGGYPCCLHAVTMAWDAR